MNIDEIAGKVQDEITTLYQNREQEGLEAYMPLIKEIITIISPYTSSHGALVQDVLTTIQSAVEAYKHSDMIGMADALELIMGRIS